jgi:hypothetical protein
MVSLGSLRSFIVAQGGSEMSQIIFSFQFFAESYLDRTRFLDSSGDQVSLRSLPEKKSSNLFVLSKL